MAVSIVDLVASDTGEEMWHEGSGGDGGEYGASVSTQHYSTRGAASPLPEEA